jgi:hypothetical protein
MRFSKKRFAALVAGVAAMVMMPLAAPVGAVTVSGPLVDGLAGPLGLAVGSDGTVYVSQTFAGVLTAVDKDGDVFDVATSDDPDASIAGVDAKGKGTLSYTVAGAVEDDFIGLVRRVLPNGRVKTLGDTAAWEVEMNPDQGNSYGFQDLPDGCAVPPFIPGGGEPYPGLIDSNTYAVAIVGGSRIVADAAGNDIVRVDANGRVSTVAVLPPVPFTITPEAAAGLGLPGCAIGATFNFEPVPTDVELGPDGLLYVSSLPGGPEGPGAPPLGGVYTVDPKTGDVNQIATGFVSAVDLAVGNDGTVYVAELFPGRISKVTGGLPETVVNVPEPGAVEVVDGTLYATINALQFGNGAVVTITP